MTIALDEEANALPPSSPLQPILAALGCYGAEAQDKWTDTPELDSVADLIERAAAGARALTAPATKQPAPRRLGNNVHVIDNAIEALEAATHEVIEIGLRVGFGKETCADLFEVLTSIAMARRCIEKVAKDGADAVETGALDLRDHVDHAHHGADVVETGGAS